AARWLAEHPRPHQGAPPCARSVGGTFGRRGRGGARGLGRRSPGSAIMIGPLLKVSGLKKAYGAIQEVAGVSFEVMPGEIFGVIGPNGSGKTTMFNSVLGQIKPDAGAIELKGHDIPNLSPLELNRLGVRRTFQTLQVFGKMSVRDNLIGSGEE